VGLAGEVDKNAALRTSPTRTAGTLYAGVLYAALDLPGLDPVAARRARRSLLISSALFGLVRTTDRLPAYRLSPAARLPRLGTLASVWRRPMTTALDEAAGAGVVLDLRSTPYQALGRITGPLADRTVHVRVLHEAVPGDRASRSIVSHFNKATKGRLVRSLLEQTENPRSATDLVELLRQTGWAVEDGPDSARGGARILDVVVAQV
jgi:cytoplasmic iron level regulating protein YaaA (DUF328/UPF0246 family)